MLILIFRALGVESPRGGAIISSLPSSLHRCRNRARRSQMGPVVARLLLPPSSRPGHTPGSRQLDKMFGSQFMMPASDPKQTEMFK